MSGININREYIRRIALEEGLTSREITDDFVDLIISEIDREAGRIITEWIEEIKEEK